MFREVILESVTHLYISAIPFAPSQSNISKLFLPKFPNLVSAAHGKLDTWPPLRQVLSGHSREVKSISFSSDGKKMLSLSEDEIKIWNMSAGGILMNSISRNDRLFMDGAISPDGKYVAACDVVRLRVWDAETGEVTNMYETPVDGPRESPLFHFVLFSPDGKLLIS